MSQYKVFCSVSLGLKSENHSYGCVLYISMWQNMYFRRTAKQLESNENSLKSNVCGEHTVVC